MKQADLNPHHRKNAEYGCSCFSKQFYFFLVAMSGLTLPGPQGFLNTDRPFLQMDHLEYKWNSTGSQKPKLFFFNQVAFDWQLGRV